MLNELYALANVLERTGVTTDVWHKHFVPNPKYVTFRILIDVGGNLVGIETIKDDKDKTAIRQWKLNGSNGHTFPSFNVEPLYNLTLNESLAEQAIRLKKQLTKNEAASLETITPLFEQDLNHWKNEIRVSKKLNKCLSHVPKEMEQIIANAPSAYQALLSLTQRIQKTNLQRFHQQLSDLISKQADLLPFFDLMFFCSGSKPSTFCLVLEVADRSKFEYPANHLKVQNWFNQCLLSFGKNETSSSGKDAYGSVNNGWQEKFGAIRMPKLGNVTLRAMTDESPCQFRYGQINATGNPVGVQSRERMSSALSWLSHSDRKKKTWTDISRGKDEKSLLFAYPSVMPEKDAEYALLFGDTKDEDGVEFEACSAQVVKSLSEIPNSMEAQMRIFVLSQPDGYRTKVEYSHNCAINHFIQAAQAWQSGCRNLPPLTIRIFDEDKEPFWSESLTPYPEEVVWCLNSVWTHLGTQVSVIKQFNMGDALDLLLDSGLKRKHTISILLPAIINNTQSFLLALGNSQHVNKVHEVEKKFSKQALKQSQLLPTILALLLDKSDIKNEVYMKSHAYLIGRLLSIADQIHDKYCEYVRNKSRPPQFFGNALMAIALEHPQQALAMFSQRMLPYHAWAKTYSGKEEELVHSFLYEWGAICNQLKELETEIPPDCTDTDKAAMLLGYLANIAKEDKP